MYAGSCFVCYTNLTFPLTLVLLFPCLQMDIPAHRPLSPLHWNYVACRLLFDKMSAINDRCEKIYNALSKIGRVASKQPHAYFSMYNIHHRYLLEVHNCTISTTNICAIEGDCVLLVLEGDWSDVDGRAPIIPTVFQGHHLSIKYALLHFDSLCSFSYVITTDSG